MKHLKSILIVVFLLITAISLAACGSKDNALNAGDNGVIVVGGNQNENQTETPNVGGEIKTPETPSDGEENENPDDMDITRVLVVYFSCTNTTKGRAEALREKLNADIYRIVPAVPYTNADLNYNTDCRANREQNDSSARPEISGSVTAMEQYDVIYIGYPIWWGQAPKIIYTFLENYDFEGKTLIPFCTSGGSGMGSSGTNLHPSAPKANWKSGRRVQSSSDIDALVNMK